MDDILIPFQNGKQIDTMTCVALYLGGLLGAALLALEPGLGAHLSAGAGVSSVSAPTCVPPPTNTC